MYVSEIHLYELLKAKIGEREAEAFVEILEQKVNIKFEEKSKIFKEDITSLKEYIDKIFATKEDLANIKAEIIKWMFIFWIGQIGVIIAILTVFFK